MKKATSSPELKVLVFAASLRAESLNRKLAEAARHNPCIKRTWVKLLGEPAGMEADRVDPVPA